MTRLSSQYRAGAKVRVHLPWPDKRLSPNARVHWATKARFVKGARETGFVCGLEGGVRSLKGQRDVRAVITFHPPDSRRRDDDNMLSSIKAFRDGIADAMDVDDASWITTIQRGHPVKGGAVLIELEAAPL